MYSDNQEQVSLSTEAPVNKENSMNVEKLNDRIKLLETERDQVRSNLAAYEGAIQDCNYWLQEFNKPSETV